MSIKITIKITIPLIGSEKNALIAQQKATAVKKIVEQTTSKFNDVVREQIREYLNADARNDSERIGVILEQSNEFEYHERFDFASDSSYVIIRSPCAPIIKSEIAYKKRRSWIAETNGEEVVLCKHDNQGKVEKKHDAVFAPQKLEPYDRVISQYSYCEPTGKTTFFTTSQTRHSVTITEYEVVRVENQ